MSYSDKDTLSYYSGNSGIVFYQNPQITQQVARFDLHRPFKLENVILRFHSNNLRDSALLRIYGLESGLPVPIGEYDLIKPIKIYKEGLGFQYVNVSFQNLFFNHHQFFIAVDSMSKGLDLCSDKSVFRPLCIYGSDEAFRTQILKLKDGSWKYGRYAFDITVIGEFDKKEKESFFTPVSEFSAQFEKVNKMNLVLCDINKDNFIDIINSSGIFINQGNLEFVNESVSFGFDNSGSVLNIALDVNCDGFQDILTFISSEDEIMHSQNSVLHLNEKGQSFASYYLTLPAITTPSNFAIGDLNGDLFPDVIITQRSGKNIMLINDEGKSFTDKSSLINSMHSANTSSVNLIDFDDDNDIDIYISNYEHENELWENKNDLIFENTYNTKFNNEAENLESNMNMSSSWLDLNDDGYLDLIQTRTYQPKELESSENFGTIIWINQGPPDFGFQISPQFQLDEKIDMIASLDCEDINNDGIKDHYFSGPCGCRPDPLYISGFSDLEYE
ncbi:MAG: FG-GAP repeat domain-containing protein, partial [Cyclobacteriaceae bacterium]